MSDHNTGPLQAIMRLREAFLCGALDPPLRIELTPQAFDALHNELINLASFYRGVHDQGDEFEFIGIRFVRAKNRRRLDSVFG